MFYQYQSLVQCECSNGDWHIKMLMCVKGYECRREIIVPVGFNAGQCSAGGKELINLKKYKMLLCEADIMHSTRLFG